VRCIAHRGFAERHPENTVAAVRAASEHADTIEIDLRRCGSGEPVVIHDATVDRVTDGSGAVADLSAETLADLDVLGSGEGVPTFDAVLEAIPEAVVLNTELKEEGLAADVLDAADNAGVDLLVSSFEPSVLTETREVSGGDLAYLTAAETEPAIEQARDLDCTAIHPHWQLCLDDFVESAHDADLAVNAWTVPSRHDATALAHVGVDGIVVDRPDVCPDQ
jgi:glycerophosphoryl diester phosphodiesterase